MKREKPLKLLGIKVTSELHRRLELIADNRGLNISSLLRPVLIRFTLDNGDFSSHQSQNITYKENTETINQMIQNALKAEIAPLMKAIEAVTQKKSKLNEKAKSSKEESDEIESYTSHFEKSISNLKFNRTDLGVTKQNESDFIELKKLIDAGMYTEKQGIIHFKIQQKISQAPKK